MTTRPVRKTIPVVRAASMMPLLKWLLQRGRPVEEMLRAAGIGYVWLEDPYAPVPVRALEHIVIQAARLDGPDVGCKIITESSLHDLAALGTIALGAPTPRAAITRVSMAMPWHCSDEIISTTPGKKTTLIQDFWSLDLDREALHIFHQFIAGMFQMVVRLAPCGEPALTRVSIVPHPVHGIDHLRPWFSGEIVAASRPVLGVTVRNAALDAPYRSPARERPMLDTYPWQRLRDGTMTGSARYLIEAMLRDGAPTIGRMAQVSDMSVRTLQRRLGEEGTTFSDLVEQVRRDAALKELHNAAGSIGDVSAHIGYARQSSLSRAMRRWTGHSPADLRAGRSATEKSAG